MDQYVYYSGETTTTIGYDCSHRNLATRLTSFNAHYRGESDLAVVALILALFNMTV
jgi:hypothetical protein